MYNQREIRIPNRPHAQDSFLPCPVYQVLCLFVLRIQTYYFFENMEVFFDGFAKEQCPFDIEFVDMDIFPSNVLCGVESGCMSLRVKNIYLLPASIFYHNSLHHYLQLKQLLLSFYLTSHYQIDHMLKTHFSSDKYNDYAKKVEGFLEGNGIRVEVDVRSEKLGYKIREARMDKVPYMIIVGENEKNNMSVSVRQRDAELDKQDMGEMSLEQAVYLVKRVE